MDRRGFEAAVEFLDVSDVYHEAKANGLSYDSLVGADQPQAFPRVPSDRFILLRELAKMDKPVNSGIPPRHVAKPGEKLGSGVSSIDELLDGGVRRGRFVQLLGGPGTGKSQLLMQFCARAHLPVNQGGLSSRVVYLDCKGDMNVKRLIKISNAGGENTSWLKTLYYSVVFSADELHSTVDSVLNLMRRGKRRVLLVDSGYTLFAFRHSKKDQYESDASYTRLLIKLGFAAKRYGLAVVMTEPETGFTPYPPLLQARINLRKGPGDIRIAQVTEPKGVRGSEQQFIISEEGVVDKI
ncbi:MAG: hypothetical protein M1357_03140 [Candidatus Marsarchaeota archaeon]|nr:hypothetical protein [Candidatus Marsarchaeota archaeon]